MFPQGSFNSWFSVFEQYQALVDAANSANLDYWYGGMDGTLAYSINESGGNGYSIDDSDEDGDDNVFDLFLGGGGSVDVPVAASADSCNSPSLASPPPPPPVNWHVEKPKPCADSPDECHTAAQSGKMNGHEGGSTHQGRPVRPSNGTKTSFDPQQLSDLASGIGNQPFSGNKTRNGCLSGAWSGPAIDYDPGTPIEGQSNSTRASGAQACYSDKSQLLGGSAAARIDIAGYQGLRDSGYNVSRCHVIAGALGGDGSMANNLFPCAQNPTNSSNMWHQFESLVRQQVRSLVPGQWLYYNVTPLYRGAASSVPYGVAMSFVTSSGYGASTTYMNWIRKNGQWVLLGN
jgi:hypothetical protein